MNTLKIVFVYERKTEIDEPLFQDQRRRVRTVPTGTGHIFELDIEGNAESFSLCRKERAKIAKVTGEYKTRISTLPLCEDCAEAWKHHPRSEWHKYVATVVQGV